MTAKEFLSQYKQAVLDIERLTKEYCTQLEQIDDISSPLGGDGTPGGGSISRATENKALRLLDKSLELQEAKLEAIQIRQTVFDTIRAVPGVEGEILYQRYVELKSWDDVCDAVHMSWSGAWKAHDRALEIIEKLI